MDSNEISNAVSEIGRLLQGKEKRFVDGEHKYVPLDASKEDILKLARARIIDLAAERRRKAELVLELCRQDELRLALTMNGDYKTQVSRKLTSDMDALESAINGLMDTYGADI